MKFIAAIVASLSALASAIPPESFGFPSAPNDTVLTTTFITNNDSIRVQPGALYGVNITARQPALAFNTSAYRSLSRANGSFLALLVDPDASTPQNPTSRFYLHYLATNLTLAPANGTTRALTNNSAARVPFRRPSPPTNSDPHRYIFYAFAQPANFSFPAAFANYSDSNRASFNLTQFISAARLPEPLAANYFFVSNKTGVPGSFVGAPGGVYPGGNGAAVTAGRGPASSAAATGRPTTSAPGGGGAGGAATSSAATGTAASATRQSTAGAAAMATPLGLLGAGIVGLAALL